MEKNKHPLLDRVSDWCIGGFTDDGVNLKTGVISGVCMWLFVQIHDYQFYNQGEAIDGNENKT